MWIDPKTSRSYTYCPDFCDNRDVAAGLLSWLKDHDEFGAAQWRYTYAMFDMLEIPKSVFDYATSAVEIVLASPKLHTIAILKALNKWPEDWEA